MHLLLLPCEIFTQIMNDVFYPFCYTFLDLRVVNKKFNEDFLTIIFRNPFKYFRDKRSLICLYIYYIDNLDNARFFVAHNVDLQLITQTYLVGKKMDIIKFKIFANNTKIFRHRLKEFDYYEFICSFCKICTASNGIYAHLNRFDMDTRKLEESLHYILNNNVLVDGVNLSTLKFHIETKYEEHNKPFKTYDKIEIATLLNVKRVNIKVDYADYDVMNLLNKLNQVEEVYIFSLCYYFIYKYLQMYFIIFISWKLNF
jgi:hypothetical protein